MSERNIPILIFDGGKVFTLPPKITIYQNGEVITFDTLRDNSGNDIMIEKGDKK
jgi:hypothetical protein